MISFEIARKRISGLDSEKIRELIKNRLLGTDSTSFGSGHSTEPGEDLLIQLLSDPKTDEIARQAVIAGCADIYAQLLGWLADTSYEEKVSKWQDVVIRISRVVDATGPRQLMGHAKSMLELALSKGNKIPEIIGATVRACMAYKDSSMLPMWESIIDKYADVAAYAFNAVLNINPNSNKVVMYLNILWKEQIKNNWPVDTAFLIRRATHKREESDLIYQVLLKVRNEDIWPQVKRELERRTWSNEWLIKLTGLKQYRYKRISELELTPYGEKKKHTEEMPEADLKEIGFGPGGYYYARLIIRSHPANIGWIDYVTRLLSKMETKNKIKVTDFIEEHEEIKHAR